MTHTPTSLLDTLKGEIRSAISLYFAPLRAAAKTVRDNIRSRP